MILEAIACVFLKAFGVYRVRERVLVRSSKLRPLEVEERTYHYRVIRQKLKTVFVGQQRRMNV